MMTVPTRAEALARLAAFAPRSGRDYAATRNEDRGPGDRTNVSMLSPYIRARLIEEEEVLRTVLDRFRMSTAQKFVQEVFWRTYWKGRLESQPALWQGYRSDARAHYARVEHEPGFARRYLAAIEGRTGNAAFDAWVRELIERGYLHNHARMWFASIWIFTFDLPWELGADFFMRHLLCGDPAANTLSWRWVAGLHTKGKTYLATRENIRRYTNGRLDGGPALADRANPIVGAEYERAALPTPATAVAPGGPALLLLHDDDAGGAGLRLDDVRIVRSFGLTAASGRAVRPVAGGVAAFARGAVEDGLSRASCPDPSGVATAADGALLGARILAVARATGAERLIVPFAPVGPVRDALVTLEAELSRGGVRIERIARRFDVCAWPHATRGFFQLKERIPVLARELGLGGLPG